MGNLSMGKKNDIFNSILVFLLAFLFTYLLCQNKARSCKNFSTFEYRFLINQ